MPATVAHTPWMAGSAMFESLGKVVALLDEDLVVVAASPGLRGLLGTPELEGRRITDFLESPAVLDCLRSGRRCEGDVRTRDSRLLSACGGVLVDASFAPGARYILSIELDDGLSAGTPSEEGERILRALEAHRWRRSAAARALGISRATLWRRMRELGIR
ncbi:MAG TPA: helix-turn-helix domain-containing protein [Thermoanaerobaculia bacterium]|nr:helix-turn-helix domain-containing protein [Thermoanaerobaculia bacterium]